MCVIQEDDDTYMSALTSASICICCAYRVPLLTYIGFCISGAFIYVYIYCKNSNFLKNILAIPFLHG